MTGTGRAGRFVRSAAAAAVAALAAPAGVLAAPATFDGNAAVGTPGDNVTWGTAANWTTNGVVDTAPTDTAPGDDLTFGGGTAGGVIDLGAARVANTLTFNRNYTLGVAATANTLTVATAPVSVTTGTTGTINAVYAGTAGIALTGGGTLVLNRATGNTFTGNITVDGAGTTLAFVGNGTNDQTALGAAGARSVTLTNGATISVITATANPSATTKSFVFGAGGGTANVATGLTLQLDDAGQFSGTGTVTKTGDGLLFLNNQGFTYTGTAVNINAGTLRVGANAGVLGTGTVAITVASGATYDNLIALSGTKNITVGGTGLGGNGALIASSGTGTIGGTVALTADTAVGGAGNLTISGVVSGGFNLSKVGAGTTILTAANTYTGNTTISGGAIRGVFGTGLPNTTNVNLNGGALEPTASFAGTLGTAAGQVQLPGGASGFSSGLAAGITVSLNGAATQLVWGTTANFNPSALVLSAPSALGTLDFQNPIDVNGATRTFTANAPIATATAATLSSPVTGAGGLTKNGAGLLVLANAGNAYTGTTTIGGGVLRGTIGSSIPATGNVTLNGGSLETGVNVTAFGTAAGQVQVTGGASGFSAFGAPVVVNLGGAAATLQYGSATFNPTTLVVNAATANNTLDFQNGLDLNGATRTFAGNGTGTNFGTISGAIGNTSATAAGVTINGTGTLVFTGTNAYTGTTTLTAGTLSVGSAANLGAAAAPVTFGGGALRVTGNTLNNLAGRTVTFTANVAIGFDIADPTNNFTIGPAFTAGQTLNKRGAGTLTLGAVANVLTALNLSDGGVLDLGNNTLNVTNAGSTTIRTVTGNGTINASGTGSLIMTVSDNDVGAVNGTTLTINAPITGAFRFENFVATNGTGVTVLTNVNSSYSGGTIINSSVVSVPQIGNAGANGPLGTGPISFGANASSTLRYTGAGETNNRVLTLAGTTTGGVIEQAGTGTLKFTANFGTPGAGAKTLMLIGSTAGVGEIAGVIQDNSATNTTAVTKNGTGTWRLSGVNTFTGAVTVTQGNLVITNSSALGAGTKTIALSNGTAGTPQLFLDGSGGDITLPSTFTYSTSVNTTAAAGAFINVAGNNTIQGTVNPISGGGDTGIVVQGGTLTISAAVTQPANNALRNLRLRGPGNGFLTGTITNGVTGATIGIVQEGTGTWAVTGNGNTFSGGVTVTSGRLLANNTSGSAFGTSTVTVSGTGVLGGSGIISGATTVNPGGTINPGNSPGTLSIAAPVTFGNTGTGTAPTYAAELTAAASPVPGTDNDLLALTGAGASGVLTLSNPDQLNLVALTPVTGPTTYTIATFASETGTFDTVLVNGGASQSANPAGANYALVTYNATNIQVTVANLAAVPEPASVGLLAVGGLGLLARRRRPTRVGRTA